MLERMEIANWPEIRSFEFYLSQLKAKYTAFRDVLKVMCKQGKIRWYYDLWRNDEFLNALKDLIDIDLKCEVIIGDSLKRDQLQFLYESARAFYDSPARNKLFAQDESFKEDAEFIRLELIPRLTTFRTLCYMRDLDVRKKRAREEEDR